MSTKKKTIKASAPASAEVKAPRRTTAKSAAAKKAAPTAAEEKKAAPKKNTAKAAKSKKSVPTAKAVMTEKALDLAMDMAIDAVLEAAPSQDVPEHPGPQAALESVAVTPPAASSGVAVAVRTPARVPAEKTPVASPAVKEPAAAPVLRDPPAPPVVVQDTSASPMSSASPVPPQTQKTITPPRVERDLPRPTGNPYLPEIATVAEIIEETHNIKTLRVVFDDPEKIRTFTFRPGQVAQLSVFGVGEATFVINSPPSEQRYLQFSVMRTGEVTAAIHKLSAGDKIGVRAPLGNGFPYEEWKGKNIVFVGGGIGMAPIRTIMLHLLDHRQDYGSVSLLYGARSPRDMAYTYELDSWMLHQDLACTLTIDAPFEGWKHSVGLLPNVLLDLGITPDNTMAVLCGPPIMIKFTVEALKKLHFSDEAIITTLERRMKCGIGICGRCNIGNKYVCIDGPVFSWAELKKLPPEL